MASGPEHYRLAETLLKVAGEGSVPSRLSLASAQVHAALALAAATALNGVGMGDIDYDDWHAAAGHPEPSPEVTR